MRVVLRLALLALVALLLFNLYRLASPEAGPPAPAPPPPVLATSAAPASPEEQLLRKLEEQILEAKGQEITSRQFLEDLLDGSFASSPQTSGKGPAHQFLSRSLYSNWLSEPLRQEFYRRAEGGTRPPQSEERSRLTRGYLEELGLPWVVEAVRALRVEDRARLVELSEPGAYPERLLRSAQGTKGSWSPYNRNIDRTTGVYFLYSSFFNEDRGLKIARRALAAAPGSLEGKTVCDMGTAIGPPLSYYEQAVGPKGRVYAVDMNPYALDFVRFCLEKGQLSRTTVVPSEEDDCKLPAGSVDCFILTGVHMGAGVRPEEAYRTRTLPWLNSMARALKPGGALILDENERFTREEVLQAFQPTKLVLEKWEWGPQNPAEARSFVAVFRKK